MAVIGPRFEDTGMPSRACLHVLREWERRSNEMEYVRRYTGRGLEHDVICLSCGEQPSAIDAALRSVPDECGRAIEELGTCAGVVGEPGFQERASERHFVHTPVSLARPMPGGIREIQALETSRQSRWLAWTGEDALVRLDLGTGEAQEQWRLPPGQQRLPDPVGMHVSPCGRFAALTAAFDRTGMVVDLERGECVLVFGRDGYQAKHSRFPAAFFRHQGWPLLVHATEWNRLDISCPETGELLTGRPSLLLRQGRPRPEHYLDFFHGALSVAPGDEWIADNGWVWHPLGVVRSWSLRHWVEQNEWESEDGPSVRVLCERESFWDGPICWADGKTLVVWGLGEDKECLVPGVRIFDVESGSQTGSFPGPRGSLVFDDFLFAFSADHGTGVWDLRTGERLLHDADLRPARYHRSAREFLTLTEDGGMQLSRLCGT